MAEKLEVSIDSRKADAGAERVEGAFEDMTRAAQGAANKMGRAGDDMDKDFKETGDSADKAGKSVTDFKGAFIFTAAIAGLTALAFGIQAVVTDIDAMGKAASKSNVSIDFFQRLEFAASQSGVPIATVEGVLKDLQLRLGLAATGSQPMIDAFESIGVNTRKASGELKNVEELLPEVIDGIATLGSDAEQAAVGVQLMGESFTQANNLFKGGSETFVDLGEKAAALGIIMSEDTFAAAANLNDEMDILTRVIKTGFAGALTSLTPILIDTIKFVQTFTTGMGKLNDEFLKMIGLADKKAFKGFTDSSANAINNAEELKIQIAGAQKALSKLDEGSAAASAIQQTIDNLRSQLGVQEVIQENIAKEKQIVVEKNALALRFVDALEAREEAAFAKKLARIKAGNAAEVGDSGGKGLVISIGSPEEETVGRTSTQERLQFETDLLAQSFISQEELRAQSLVRENQLIIDALDERVISQEQAQVLITDITARENAKRVSIAQQAASLLIGGFASITRAFADQSAQAFNIAKGFSIAEAVINGAVGFTKALSQGGILGFAGAASIALATAGQVATISRTQPGSSGTVGGLTGGVGLSNASALQNAQPTQRDGNASREVNITINGFTNKQSVRDDIMPAIRTLVDQDDEQLFSNTSRQAQVLG